MRRFHNVYLFELRHCRLLSKKLEHADHTYGTEPSVSCCLGGRKNCWHNGELFYDKNNQPVLDENRNYTIRLSAQWKSVCCRTGQYAEGAVSESCGGLGQFCRMLYPSRKLQTVW